jgi:hypothetical protein
LADEIAWRGSLLDLIAEMRGVLLSDIRERFYETKATLPALVREVRGLLELEMKVIDSAKGLPFLKDAQSKQVSAIYARFELTRKHLIDRGIMDASGRLIPRPGIANKAAEKRAAPPATAASSPRGSRGYRD